MSTTPKLITIIITDLADLDTATAIFATMGMDEDGKTRAAIGEFVTEALRSKAAQEEIVLPRAPQFQELINRGREG